MDIETDPGNLRSRCMELRCSGASIGLVPTMGYYHEGHLSLMRRARQRADFVVVSLFVNPAQFSPGEDLESYPRDFERDRELAEAEGADLMFAPETRDVYASGHATWVDVPALGQHLCGASRPGHFRGVCTVVCKLFNLTLPHWAFFGRKDWQQLVIVRRMARDLDLPVEIVDCPIAREEDGLAMSSRNQYLGPEERREAASIYAGLCMVRERAGRGERDAETLLRELRRYYERFIPSGQIDYLQLVDPDELTPLAGVEDGGLLAVAVRVGKARLIDNMLI